MGYALIIRRHGKIVVFIPVESAEEAEELARGYNRLKQALGRKVEDEILILHTQGTEVAATALATA